MLLKFGLILHSAQPLDLNKEYMTKEQAKDELIQVLTNQLVDLTLMSKIEIGEDVIDEIRRLKGIINEN